MVRVARIFAVAKYPPGVGDPSTLSKKWGFPQGAGTPMRSETRQLFRETKLQVRRFPPATSEGHPLKRVGHGPRRGGKGPRSVAKFVVVEGQGDPNTGLGGGGSGKLVSGWWSVENRDYTHTRARQGQLGGSMVRGTRAMVPVYPQGTRARAGAGAWAAGPALSRACACARYPCSGACLQRDAAAGPEKIFSPTVEKFACLC